MDDWNGWLKLVAEEVLLVVAFAVVLEGCRRLMRDGISRGPALMVALGLVLPVWEASASLHLIKDVARLQAEKTARLNIYLHEPGGGWEKADLTPEQRTSMSTMVASINFKFFGRWVEVIDPQGKRVAFVPTREMVGERELILRNEKGAEDAATAAFDRGTHLFISAAGFMLVGLALGWRQRVRARRGA